MTAETGDRLGERDLLAAAAGGEEEAFRLLTDPHRRALHLHCYRMLGSVHDADDALQETLLRAWRALDRYELRSPFGAWLHRIATNVCLTALDRRRRRREVPLETGEAAWGELAHLQPYPDRLLGELPATAPGPEARYAEREAVELAFVTAVQLLPPRQRAVLILRDVLGWSASEAAETLGDSLASVNSALQRARATLERARAVGARAHAPPGEEAERELLRRFMAAWDAVDVDGIVGLLAGDALLTMPPVTTYLRGREALRESSPPSRRRGGWTRSGSCRRASTASRRSSPTCAATTASTARTASWSCRSGRARSPASSASRRSRRSRSSACRSSSNGLRRAGRVGGRGRGARAHAPAEGLSRA